MEEIDTACQEAVNGLPSRRPVIEMTIPSVLDKTISPPGTHTEPVNKTISPSGNINHHEFMNLNYLMQHNTS